MILLRKPAPDRVHAYLAAQQREPCSYNFCGVTRDIPNVETPAGFVFDHRRVVIGTGDAAWHAARAAIESWVMFGNGWTELYAPIGAPRVGNVVGMLVRIGGCWWLNPCRVLYEIDEIQPVRRCGFGYGTLNDHAESGEERFLIEQDEMGQVWYDLAAFSRPRNPLARLFNPWVRHIQRRFGRESVVAMVDFVSRIAN
ncbi:hypothetical protein ETAA8_30290 [Anatilimnocola aggregata]|uniref:DUF1990 domain-containing protein n=1 Tax=Anatilimnocola aggregata TaxID=2528021 RepID=A0A517YCG4_9BACT|nr:DUF1990 domain-containing protein [Anatilimnocola aggregata]QDU27937.1 hypothetical protein ETAA8_30290 [Anatilimnocola aggregata]